MVLFYGWSALSDSDPVFGRNSDTNRLATSISIRKQGQFNNRRRDHI
ncbi:MAG: hypothetical protein LBC74_10680 [Planctomycetaceae bacterium]|nr:hypothetical protein [Planctomycetaceae bacterium]